MSHVLSYWLSRVQVKPFQSSIPFGPMTDPPVQTAGHRGNRSGPIENGLWLGVEWRDRDTKRLGYPTGIVYIDLYSSSTSVGTPESLLYEKNLGGLSIDTPWQVVGRKLSSDSPCQVGHQIKDSAIRLDSGSHGRARSWTLNPGPLRFGVGVRPFCLFQPVRILGRKDSCPFLISFRCESLSDRTPKMRRYKQERYPVTVFLGSDWGTQLG